MYSENRDNISEYFAQMSQIIIELVSQHSEKIVQLFDFESLCLFLRQLDQVIKERGTQIVSHFFNTKDLDKQTQSDQIDYLCEEMTNFSYLYRTYYNFVSCLIFR